MACDVTPARVNAGPCASSLALGAAGDVLAARQIADELMAASGDAFAQPALPRLVLTAALLHTGARICDPSPRDVARCLSALIADEETAAAFATSPMQFVRYAGAELSTLGACERRTLIEGLTELIDPGGLDQGCTEQVLRRPGKP